MHFEILEFTNNIKKKKKKKWIISTRLCLFTSSLSKRLSIYLSIKPSSPLHILYFLLYSISLLLTIRPCLIFGEFLTFFAKKKIEIPPQKNF